MPFYAIYETATGALRSTGTVVAEELPVGLAMNTYADAPDQTVLQWDAVALDYVTRPPAQRFILSPLEFTRRFTLTENAALNMVRLNPDTPLQTKAQLETLRDYLVRATNIDLLDGDTIAGASVAVDVLVSLGLVTDKPVRLTAILAPEAVPL